MLPSSPLRDVAWPPAVRRCSRDVTFDDPRKRLMSLGFVIRAAACIVEQIVDGGVDVRRSQLPSSILCVVRHAHEESEIAPVGAVGKKRAVPQAVLLDLGIDFRALLRQDVG